tara:strand:- start:1190 stop:2068 length:879 start_codon:yes stop_codon:yes gene_type:complete
MAKQSIGLGSSANDGSGDTLRAGGDKVNDNFTEVYNALGDGSTIAANTGTLVSNAYAIATYAANSAINTRLNLYAKVANVASLAALANTNSAIAQRAQVANVVTLAALANNNTRLALINTNLVQTNNAIRTLVSDRTQVSNVFSVFSSGKSYSTVPNYGAAVTYDVSANASNAYIVSNMGFGKGGAAFNNPELTVRNETTIAFDLNGLAGAHPFHIRSGNSGTNNFSNTLIHVAVDGTITTGASAQGKNTGVLYWQIPHDIVSSGRDSYQYYCSSHAGAMYGNVNIKDSGAI